MKNNIILIGMPGAGKSTAGVILAKTLGYDFIDTDILICRNTGATLQDYIDAHGIDSFLRIEESTALSLDCDNTVIATGGSMALSDPAMGHLKRDSVTVFLDVPFSELAARLKNIRTRGILLSPGQTLENLYHTRVPIYKRYADITVKARNGADIEETVGEIIQSLRLTKALNL